MARHESREWACRPVGDKGGGARNKEPRDSSARSGRFFNRTGRVQAPMLWRPSGKGGPRHAAQPDTCRARRCVEKQPTRRSRYARSPPVSTCRNLKGAVEISDTACTVDDGGWLAGRLGEDWGRTGGGPGCKYAFLERPVGLARTSRIESNPILWSDRSHTHGGADDCGVQTRASSGDLRQSPRAGLRSCKPGTLPRRPGPAHIRVDTDRDFPAMPVVGGASRVSSPDGMGDGGAKFRESVASTLSPAREASLVTMANGEEAGCEVPGRELRTMADWAARRYLVGGGRSGRDGRGEECGIAAQTRT